MEGDSLKTRFTSMQVLSIGFAVIILIGGILLFLPISNREGISFINAIFTSASAACVTGLVLYDTYSQFTIFGQAVILILIQVGGLGFMMVGILFSMFMGRRIGLRQRSLLMESVGSWKVGGIVRLTKRILITTGIIEFTGTLILAFRFCPRFGLWEGIWCALFHSVSAFCNAGFDIMGRIAPYNSLMTFADDWVVNLTIITLIVVGGLGFFLWNDVMDNKWQVSKYQLHTKIVLSMTAILITLGTVGFFLLEKNTAFSGMPAGERLLASLFQSVTPRTAGFNTIDLTTLSQGGRLLTMLLMLVGAGSGSTAGGIKVTTLTVLMLSVLSQSYRHSDLNIFGRRLEDDAVKRACSNTTLYVMLSLTGCFILCIQGFSISDSMFEALSAIGTVGLSMGITPQLPVLSKIAIILLMYSGRVGSLSVAMAMARKREEPRLKKTSEKIIIG
jgi:trk system potassium uptake protein